MIPCPLCRVVCPMSYILHYGIGYTPIVTPNDVYSFKITLWNGGSIKDIMIYRNCILLAVASSWDWHFERFFHDTEIKKDINLRAKFYEILELYKNKEFLHKHNISVEDYSRYKDGNAWTYVWYDDEKYND